MTQLSRAEVETWVTYHKDWPDTMAYKVGAALLVAWEELGALIKASDAARAWRGDPAAITWLARVTDEARAALPRDEAR